MRGSGKQSEAIHSRVGRGKSRRGVSEIVALLESVHDHHHSWTENEKKAYAEAMTELQLLEGSLAKTPGS